MFVFLFLFYYKLKPLPFTTMPISIKYSLEPKKFRYNSFQDIEQLDRYNDIVYIDCSWNQLTSLPEYLPNSLQKLYCFRNELTSLPNLPNSLQKIECDDNQLTSLPEHLPNSLQKLDCYYNKLTSLPEHLPNSLQILKCSNYFYFNRKLSFITI